MNYLVVLLLSFICSSCGSDDEIDYSSILGKWIVSGTCLCNQGGSEFEFVDVESDWSIEFTQNKNFSQNHEILLVGKVELRNSANGQIKGVLNPENGESIDFYILEITEFTMVISYDIGDEGLTYRYEKDLSNEQRDTT